MGIFDGFSEDDFKKAIEANPEAWGKALTSGQNNGSPAGNPGFSQSDTGGGMIWTEDREFTQADKDQFANWSNAQTGGNMTGDFETQTLQEQYQKRMADNPDMNFSDSFMKVADGTDSYLGQSYQKSIGKDNRSPNGGLPADTAVNLDFGVGMSTKKAQEQQIQQNAKTEANATMAAEMGGSNAGSAQSFAANTNVPVGESNFNPTASNGMLSQGELPQNFLADYYNTGAGKGMFETDAAAVDAANAPIDDSGSGGVVNAGQNANNLNTASAQELIDGLKDGDRGFVGDTTEDSIHVGPGADYDQGMQEADHDRYNNNAIDAYMKENDLAPWIIDEQGNKLFLNMGGYGNYTEGEYDQKFFTLENTGEVGTYGGKLKLRDDIEGFGPKEAFMVALSVASGGTLASAAAAAGLTGATAGAIVGGGTAAVTGLAQSGMEGKLDVEDFLMNVAKGGAGGAIVAGLGGFLENGNEIVANLSEATGIGADKLSGFTADVVSGIATGGDPLEVIKGALTSQGIDWGVGKITDYATDLMNTFKLEAGIDSAGVLGERESIIAELGDDSIDAEYRQYLEEQLEFMDSEDYADYEDFMAKNPQAKWYGTEVGKAQADLSPYLEGDPTVELQGVERTVEDVLVRGTRSQVMDALAVLGISSDLAQNYIVNMDKFGEYGKGYASDTVEIVPGDPEPDPDGEAPITLPNNPNDAGPQPDTPRVDFDEPDTTIDWDKDEYKWEVELDVQLEIQEEIQNTLDEVMSGGGGSSISDSDLSAQEIVEQAWENATGSIADTTNPDFMEAVDRVEESLAGAAPVEAPVDGTVIDTGTDGTEQVGEATELTDAQWKEILAGVVPDKNGNGGIDNDGGDQDITDQETVGVDGSEGATEQEVTGSGHAEPGDWLPSEGTVLSNGMDDNGQQIQVGSTIDGKKVIGLKDNGELIFEESSVGGDGAADGGTNSPDGTVTGNNTDGNPDADGTTGDSTTGDSVDDTGEDPNTGTGTTGTEGDGPGDGPGQGPGDDGPGGEIGKSFASGGGGTDAEWSELFPYTKITPLQKKKLLPMVKYIKQARGMV